MAHDICLDEFASMSAYMLIKGYLSFGRICFALANWSMTALCCIFAPALNICPCQRIHMAVPSVTPFCLISDLLLHRGQRTTFKSCKIHPAATKLTCATEQAAPVVVSNCETEQAAPMKISNCTNPSLEIILKCLDLNQSSFKSIYTCHLERYQLAWR